MSLHVHIRRLVLEGLAISTSRTGILQAAVESELERLLHNGELSPELLLTGTVANISGGTIQLSAGSKPTDVGVEIARAVHMGIGRDLRGHSTNLSFRQMPAGSPAIDRPAASNSEVIHAKRT
jgi:hypothetical protein